MIIEASGVRDDGAGRTRRFGGFGRRGRSGDLSKFGGERRRRVFRFGAKAAFRKRDDDERLRRRQNETRIAASVDVFFEVSESGANAAPNAVGEEVERRRRADRDETEGVETRVGSRFEPGAADRRERFRRGKRFKRRREGRKRRGGRRRQWTIREQTGGVERKRDEKTAVGAFYGVVSVGGALRFDLRRRGALHSFVNFSKISGVSYRATVPSLSGIGPIKPRKIG